MNGKYYALKETPKYKLNKRGKLFSFLNEPNILKKLNKSNFVPEIISSFQDYDNMYIVTTFYDGPPLHVFMYENLSEKQIRFMIACIIQSLKYLREKQIIHRDLFFGNIILDKEKYFNLIDFSGSINYTKRKSKDFFWHGKTLITPPESLNVSNFYYNSDYYTLGHIILFLLFKNYLFEIKKTKKLDELIIEYNLTEKYSKNLFNFVRDIINRNATERLGYTNIKELMNHPWFSDINWKKLEQKKIVSPFKNIKYTIKDTKKNNCIKFNKTKNEEIEYSKLIKTKFYEKIIKNFEYSKYKNF